MSEYKEYGYKSENAITAHSYLFPSLLGMLDPSAKTRILDVGCGNGYIARKLIELGYDVYGIDASIEGITIASSKYPDRFFIQDLSSSILPEELKELKFNLIISTEVVEHLYDPKKYITFCKEVLLNSGGGEIIISTPYNGYLKNLVFSILNGWDRHLNPLWDGGHIKFWSRKTLSKLLSDEGFLVLKFEGSGRIPFLWKSMFLKAKI